MTQAKVLVVDDEAMIRWSIEQTLRTAGHDVSVAATVAEGMALVRQVLPEVVFLDVRLPDADGLSVLRQIKHEVGTETAVIVMTAFEEDCSAEEAKRLGAFEYLKKPFDFDGLDGLVHKALQAATPA
jgi:DNA-binding NtrC family response regulator